VEPADGNSRVNQGIAAVFDRSKVMMDKRQMMHAEVYLGYFDDKA
jgi:hypothetical protein